MIESPAALSRALAGTGYLADQGLATAGWLALRIDRPLFLEGEAGVGKTAFAAALASAAGLPMIRLQCYEGLDLAQALYDWDFPRQILHLRTVEATGHADPHQVEASLYDRRFLIARPLLQALESAPCVLLIDEVDRADDEFEAYLLELLSDWAVTIPELGRVAADRSP
jgi:MoxR-like ATPase